MSKHPRNAVVLWTGGKDSCLALFEAIQQGFQIVSLVTFAPRHAQFLAHPLHFIKYQAEAMRLPHAVVEISEPMREGYANAIEFLKHQYALGYLITGDIDEVDGHPNWIKECSAASGVEVITPLWGRDRNELLEKLIANNFVPMFSCVKQPWLSADWLAKELNQSVLEQLRRVSELCGMDICGERGEYHTLVIDGPLFRERLSIDVSAKRAKDEMFYLDIEKVSLRPKD